MSIFIHHVRSKVAPVVIVSKERGMFAVSVWFICYTYVTD